MNRIHYFCTIAQTGSLARAAEFLKLSPAALSKSMKILETEVGIKLMRASGRGIVITPEGVRFAERGAELLKELSELPQIAKGTLKNTQALKLGSFEVFTTYLLGEIYQEFAENFDLTVHELSPGKIEQALLERSIDVGLSYIAIPHKDLDHLEMGKVRMGVFGVKNAFPLIPLSQLPFVIPVEPLSGSPTKAQGLDGWQPTFGPRNVRFKVTLMESALELARRQMAVAYLPHFVVELHNKTVMPKFRLKEIPLVGKGVRTNPVYLIKRKNDPESTLMKKLAKVIRTNIF